MKNVLSIAMILFTLIYLSGCCNCGSDTNSENIVKGYITIIGNNIMEKPALKTDDGKIFLLQVSKELKTELLKKSGNYFFIKYGDLREEDGFPLIVVEKIIPISDIQSETKLPKND